ncbi:MAG: hypothetical protein NVS3B25_32670 [Hymenobacter sp.]
MLNRAFWGSFLTAAYRRFGASSGWPAGYGPLQEFFEAVSVVEVALLYLATFAFAAALRRVGWIGPAAGTAYMAASLVGVGVSVLPPSVPAPLVIATFAVSIPAIPFLLPYLMALTLLRRVGA